MLGATAKEKKRLLVLELEAHLLDALVKLEDFPELLRNLAQALHDVHAPLELACAVL